jgi:alpha-galactosidase
MQDPFVRQEAEGSFSLGNAAFQMAVGLRAGKVPVLRSLNSAKQPGVNWASPARPLGPELIVQGVKYSLGSGNLRFSRFEADTELRLVYALGNGLEVAQHLRPSPDKAVWRSWVSLHNPTTTPVAGITRFDAANLIFSAGEGQPRCGYVLGWLEGPRADAPGHHALPFTYCGWIPKLLYGKADAELPPRPESWVAPVYRFCQERLTRLPLQSGKRSTYDDHPWVAVLDPARRGGWFLGFEWSGTWKIDAEHLLPSREVSIHACSDANSHDLRPGEKLVSPAAFLGVFAGDWDDASNLCRWYVDDEIIPKIEKPWPTTLHVYVWHNTPQKRSDAYLRREMALAAELGYETTYVETIWWKEGADPGDFSVGLGDFEDSRVKFPSGLRAMSDYLHGLGINMGLWFEIERVDIRTCNRLRHPWKPEWIVQQKGHPYRSWGPHFFMLCLGVKEAQEWALENLLWAIREYDLDYIMFDSNEWGVCDDPAHGHGAGDGEWAQIQGFYRVMEGVRAAHPNIMILNSSGGSQRGDFGIARYSNCIHPHDQAVPSTKQRRYMHGTGCMYPTSYQANLMTDYTAEPHQGGWVEGNPPQLPPAQPVSAERFEWRVLNRMLGYYADGLELSAMPEYQLEILRKALPFYKRIRHCTHGDRYVLAGPGVQYAPMVDEDAHWECYQHVARDGGMAVLYLYRCLSPEPARTWKLRGLDPQARYRADFWSGLPERDFTGAELMEKGYTCTLKNTRNADIMVLAKN